MLKKAVEILAEYTETDAGEICPETDLKADLDLNSLDLMELAAAFEEAFDVQIPDRSIAEIQTVGDILKILELCGE